MKHRAKFREEEEENQDLHQQKQAETKMDFHSVEELLRFDALEIHPPTGVRQRLRQSVRGEARNKWWSRFFKGQKESG